MHKMHNRFVDAHVLFEIAAKLGIAVTVWIFPLVLLPQQLTRYAVLA
jgi:hypothetical protein